MFSSPRDGFARKASPYFPHCHGRISGRPCTMLHRPPISPANHWSTAMAKAAHSESHFLASETVRDVVIGTSDGLTVPFALAAGLTGAIAANGIIVTAGLAEVAAGAI